jgi:hypothetical protein
VLNLLRTSKLYAHPAANGASYPQGRGNWHLSVRFARSERVKPVDAVKADTRAGARRAGIATVGCRRQDADLLSRLSVDDLLAAPRRHEGVATRGASARRALSRTLRSSRHVLRPANGGSRVDSYQCRIFTRGEAPPACRLLRLNHAVGDPARTRASNEARTDGIPPLTTSHPPGIRLAVTVPFCPGPSYAADPALDVSFMPGNATGARPGCSASTSTVATSWPSPTRNCALAHGIMAPLSKSRCGVTVPRALAALSPLASLPGSI